MVPSITDATAPALIWLALAIVAAIVEVLIPHFGLIFVSLGALAGAVAAFAALGIAAQIVAFALTLGASLVVLRPRLIRSLWGKGVPSRTDTLVGQRGRVTDGIDQTLGTGRVTVAGQDWAARSSTPIEAGADVLIAGADGIVLEVTRIDDSKHEVTS